ncbi:hypothetical protein V866_007053 [Kwoniella sp. B9012]
MNDIDFFNHYPSTTPSSPAIETYESASQAGGSSTYPSQNDPNQSSGGSPKSCPQINRNSIVRNSPSGLGSPTPFIHPDTVCSPGLYSQIAMNFMTGEYRSGFESPTLILDPDEVDRMISEARESYERDEQQARYELSEYQASSGKPLRESPGTFEVIQMILEARDAYPGDESFLERCRSFLDSVQDQESPHPNLLNDGYTPPHRNTNREQPVSPLDLNSTAEVAESSTQTTSNDSIMAAAPSQAGLRDQAKGSINAIPPVTISDMISRWQSEE